MLDRCVFCARLIRRLVEACSLLFQRSARCALHARAMLGPCLLRQLSDALATLCVCDDRAILVLMIDRCSNDSSLLRGLCSPTIVRCVFNDLPMRRVCAFDARAAPVLLLIDDRSS